MISENKLFYNFNSVLERKPITADILLTNFCNNKCGYCVYAHNVQVQKNEYLHFEDFKVYIDRLLELGVKGFILTGGGEPTINPDFEKIVNYLEEKKLNYGINTNFNVLRLIKPNFLKISLDGYDEESYKKNRGVNTFSKVIQNIQTYLDWKKKNNVSTKVGLQCLVTEKGTATKFYNAVKNFEVDYFNFRPLEKSFDEKRNEDELIREIEELKKKDERVILNYKWKELNHKFTSCPANCLNISLNYDGKVLYCCSRANEIVGHILDSDILEKKVNYKIDFSKCDVPCRLTGANLSMENLENKPNDFMFI